MEETQTLESTTVGIYRTACVIKGGRRFSFGALVVVGDRNGNVGIGYGKAPGVPSAIEKAQKDARKKVVQVTLQDGTLPHSINCRFSASIVRLVPAAPGTGVIAGATVRAVLELAGVRDCLTKVYGSSNPKNLCRATFEGLQQLQTRSEIEALRGIEIGATEVESRLEAGRRFSSTAEQPTEGEPATAVKASPPGPKAKDTKPTEADSQSQGAESAPGGDAAETPDVGAAVDAAPPASEATDTSGPDHESESAS